MVLLAISFDTLTRDEPSSPSSDLAGGALIQGFAYATGGLRWRPRIFHSLEAVREYLVNELDRATGMADALINKLALGDSLDIVIDL